MNRGHIPLRSCLICGAKTGKRELVRIVRTSSGRIQVDATGKLSGRGAYLCHSPSCWGAVLKGDRLERSLRGTLASEDRLAVEESARQMKLASLERTV
ncbi:MAG: YlxR family protein [Chloroflexi bacterium]|nr:YlxR family protein [Chloroflexota bacterium]